VRQAGCGGPPPRDRAGGEVVGREGIGHLCGFAHRAETAAETGLRDPADRERSGWALDGEHQPTVAGEVAARGIAERPLDRRVADPLVRPVTFIVAGFDLGDGHGGL
jgi:hypothetical protein